MLLAPSFSPKVQTVLDCLFNAVGALSGRSCPSTSRSFSYSVVLAMPEEAWEATLVYLRALTASTGEGCSTPRLHWTWAGMRTCRRSLSFFVPAPSCCVLGSFGLLCLTILGRAGNRRGSTAGRGSTNTDSSALTPLTQWINNHRHGREPHGTAFWSRTCFLYFQHFNKHSSQNVCHLMELKTYTKTVLDHLNGQWFLWK